MHRPTRERVTGVVLAGGRGSRMGGQDKGLIELDERPMIAHVLDSLAPQVAGVLINANRNLERYGEFGWPVMADALAGFQGPLAGILAAMQRTQTKWVLTLPCDAPRVPADLRQRLADALLREQARIAVAHDGKRLQVMHALLPVDLAPDLAAYLESGERKARAWIGRHKVVQVDFSDSADCFHNLNRPEDHQRFSGR